MSLDFCKTQMVGRLVSNPKPLGNSGCRFEVASNNRQNSTVFLPVVCWDKLAAQVLEYCVRGTTVSISGDLELRKYDRDDGDVGREFRIIATSVGFGSSTRRDDKNEEDTVQKSKVGVSAETRKEVERLAGSRRAGG